MELPARPTCNAETGAMVFIAATWRDEATHEMPLIQLPSPQRIGASKISEMPNPRPSSEAKKIVDQDPLDGDEGNA